MRISTRKIRARMPELSHLFVRNVTGSLHLWPSSRRYSGTNSLRTCPGIRPKSLRNSAMGNLVSPNYTEKPAAQAAERGLGRSKTKKEKLFFPSNPKPMEVLLWKTTTQIIVIGKMTEQVTLFWYPSGQIWILKWRDRDFAHIFARNVTKRLRLTKSSTSCCANVSLAKHFTTTRRSWTMSRETSINHWENSAVRVVGRRTAKKVHKPWNRRHSWWWGFYILGGHPATWSITIGGIGTRAW